MTRIFDKLGWVIAALVSLAVLAALAGLVSAGPLDPTGPPGSTGKNVITSLPFTISQPGSYVLNGNLTASASGNGITVSANNVTIDLQGFELVGASLGSGAISSSQSGLTVRNGTIRDWTGTAVLANADSVVDGLRLMGNGSGIALGTRASVTNCEVQGSSSSNGIIVGIASLVSKCMVVLNSGQGVSAGDDSTISDTVTRSNGGAEIVGGNRVVLENCVADGNGSADDGIRVGTDSTIRGCTASNNGGVEILAGAGSTLETCTADGAGTDGDGIQVGDRATVRNCLAQNNHGAGIHVTGQRSRIESNQALYNYRGIEVDLGANVIVLNSAAGNVQPDLQLINYKVAAGNEYSPATSVSAATNPWSNIGY